MPPEPIKYEDMPQEVHEVVHKAKDAAQAVEVAREVQMAKLAKDTAKQTEQVVTKALKDIFGEGDSKDPERMTVLVRRIPLLCTNIDDMHKLIASNSERLEKIEGNIAWGVRIVIGSVILGVLKLIFMP